MKEIFPDSKIILLTRDIRENVVSKCKRKINGQENEMFHAGTWNFTYEQTDELHHLYPESVLIIHYEDLVRKTKETLNIICCFLNIKYTDEMLRFNEYFKEFIGFKKNAITPAFKNSIDEFHENMFRPVNQENLETWKLKLDSVTAKKISTIGYKTGKQLGYDFENPIGLKKLNLKDRMLILKAKIFTKHLFNFYLSLPLKIKLAIKKIRYNSSVKTNNSFTNEK